MKKKLPVRPVSGAVVSLLFFIGILTVAKACGPKEDGTWMRCHNVQIYETWISVAMIVAWIIVLFVSSIVIRRVLDVIIGVLGIAGILLPYCMPMCMMDTMLCHAVMKPFVVVFCLISLLIALIDLIISFLKGKQEKPKD